MSERRDVPEEQKNSTQKIIVEPIDHALGRGRGGFGTKFHLLCDANGTPLSCLLSGGQAQECRFAQPLVELGLKNLQSLCKPAAVAGDKGYSHVPIRRMLLERGIHPLIPPKRGKEREAYQVPFDAKAYRRRNVIERLVGWLKERRRICTRYEKLAVNYLAMLKLAMLERCMKRLNDSSDRA
jgi:transposase